VPFIVEYLSDSLMYDSCTASHQNDLHYKKHRDSNPHRALLGFIRFPHAPPWYAPGVNLHVQEYVQNSNRCSMADGTQ